jgi:geranylgeranyl diphosphate/geranylgeranyl-bacteriochlorophyllide a reductase
MTVSHDVVVIGAGPAGAIAARDLARRGARVALVDGSHPREKPCGGGVTRRALDLIGDLGGAAGVRVEGAVFGIGGRRARVGLRADDDALTVFPRRTFDAALLDAAAGAGAIVVPARATRIERAGTGWTVQTAHGAVGAAWLLGADGASGIVRKRVHRPFARRQLSIAAGVFVRDATAADVVVAFLDRPPGYLWSFPRPDHLAVGACAQADVCTPETLQAATAGWLDGYAPAAGRPRRAYAWPIPSLAAADCDAERPSGDRWMLLGDAAGLVDPITREGIYFALQSGIAAARALTGRDPACEYDRAVRDTMHDELRRAARIKEAFFRPRFTSLLIAALARSAPVRDVMIDLIAGRQSYRTLKRRLLATLEFGLMWKLFAKPSA